jgi:hypothetical protein
MYSSELNFAHPEARKMNGKQNRRALLLQVMFRNIHPNNYTTITLNFQ